MLFKINCRVLCDLLHWFAIAGGKRCSERSMAIDEGLERIARAVHVQTALNARRKREVISRLMRRELMQKPKRLLVAGQRSSGRTGITLARIMPLLSANGDFTEPLTQLRDTDTFQKRRK